MFCFCLCNSHRLCFCHSSACNALLGFFLFFFFFVSFCLAFVILVAWPNQGRDSGRDSGLAVRSLARSFVRALFWFWLLLYDVSGCNNNNTYITLNALAERLPPFLHTYIYIKHTTAAIGRLAALAFCFGFRFVSFRFVRFGPWRLLVHFLLSSFNGVIVMASRHGRCKLVSKVHYTYTCLRTYP